MKLIAPEKIYIHPDIGDREFIRPWLKVRFNANSVEYIRADVLMKCRKEEKDDLRTIEPKIGERVAWNNNWYRCYSAPSTDCSLCDMCGRSVCGMVECSSTRRKDGTGVIFIREGHYNRKKLNEILLGGRIA